MRIVSIGLAAVAALLVGMSAAHAQEMTIEELVALAIDKAPELQAARSEIAVAEGRTTQAALRPNPMMGVTQQQMAGGMMTSSVEIEWPLDLFRRPARVAAAHSMADVTTLAVRNQERLLASAIREQAGGLLAAQRTLEIANEALIAARRMRDLLDRRFSEGGSTRLDANLATVEALRLEADVALATGVVDAAMIELKALAGLPADTPLALRDSLETLASTPPVPPLTPTAALEARPDLREALARILLADTRAEEAQRGARADVALAAGYTRNDFGFPQLGLDPRGMAVPIHDIFHAVSFGARVSLPFLNRNQGALAAARAERQGAEALFAARRLAARGEIDAAIARDREARRAVDLYAKDIRTLARQNVEVMLEAYDLGRFPLADVLSEQRRYLDIESSYTAVLLRAYEARTAVSRAFGEIR